MPKVTDEYRSARRDEIIEAAKRAFERRGFQATSMADIIAESGLSAGAIYGHFPSKTDIVVGVAKRAIGARSSDIDALLTASPLTPPATIIRVLMAGMMRDLGTPTMIVQVWGEAVSMPEIKELADEVFGQLQAGYLRYLVAWHQQEHGLGAEEAGTLAAEQLPLFISAAQGYILQSALFPGFDGEAYLTTVEHYLPR